MKKILAVSGGIDSVVMLHQLRDDPEVVVAHFDHGIRPNSVEDFTFVEKLANQYGKPFYGDHAQLGHNCSEESARTARYQFLRRLAKELDGKIYTAHHDDDVVESVAINLLRGTGWRGLAVLNNNEIERPLLGWNKKDIYRYAAENKLHFRLDQTNSDDKYLRNRVREALSFVDETQKRAVVDLAAKQRELVRPIDTELSAISDEKYPRALMNVDSNIALEILRTILARQNISQTRPQLRRIIKAIRNYANGKQFSVNKDYSISIGRYHFWITPAKIVDRG